MINAVPTPEETVATKPPQKPQEEGIVEEIEEIEAEVVDWFDYVSWYWQKIATVLLTAHALYGLWESVQFMFVEYPQLEKSLNLHLISQDLVQEITVNAVILMLTTAVNIYMAMRLNSVKENRAALIDLIVATILIIMTPFLQTILDSLPILEAIEHTLPV